MKKEEPVDENAEQERDSPGIKREELYSLGEKGFFLISLLSGFLLLAWIFSFF